jgi:DnaK suppressor protein
MEDLFAARVPSDPDAARARAIYNSFIMPSGSGSAARLRKRSEERLRARRAELVASGPAPIEPNRTDTASVGVPDEDAQALSEMLQTLASTRNRGSARELAEIDRALGKLHGAPDEFGQCEDCGEEIPEKRLALLPWARYCAECQAKLDPARNQTRKKITDYR